MCGITGFIHKSTNEDQEVKELNKMLDTIRHRGPDDFGTEITHRNNYTIALGHRRLSILDLSSGGHQPMRFEELSIIYNGEIYNFEEIRANLEKLGYKFSSSSDTEVILKAYHKWGVKCFEKFNGMWAIAIFDKTNNSLLLCRDRSGVKPLYWYLKDNNFIFGSELKAFHKSTLFKKGINTIGLSLYFQYGYIKEPHTIFNNTYKLEAGHYLTVNLKEHIEVEQHKYWDITDFYLKPKLKLDDQEALAEIERLMIKGFNYRMISDVPVGLFLSGGIDSSLVTAILQSTNTNKLKTFTIGFSDVKYDEAPFAKKIAEHLGTDHHELYCSNSDIQEIIDTLPEIIDEPFADSSIIPTLLVSKFTRQHVTVALSADGGDEVFGGYQSFIDAYNITVKAKKLGSFPAKIATNLLENFPLTLLKSYGSKYYKLLELTSHPESYLENYQLFNKHTFNKEMDKLYGLAPVNLYNNLNYSKFDNPYDAMLCNAYKFYLNNDVLQKVDKAGMAFSLEGREPFLDVNLMEFAAQLPINFKINGDQLKWASKEILFKYIPKNLYHGKKMGFSVPSSQLDKYISTRFNDEQLKELINLGILKNTTNYELLFKNNWRTKWLLYIFYEWYKKWMK